MKKLIAILLVALSLALLPFSPKITQANFEDVPSNSSYFQAINFLQENNIVSGYSDGTFKPTNSINRVEFLKIVLEGSGIELDTTQNTGFTDVDENSWYAPYLKKAKKEAWVTGYPDNTFHPGQTINNVEALKIVAEVQNWQLKQSSEITQTPYVDTPIDAWYLPYVEFAKSKEIIDNSSNKLNPAKLLNRGEVANLLYETILKGVSTFNVEPTANSPTPIENQANTENLNFKQVQFKSQATNSFSNILLDETFPNIFYKNEIYTFKGSVLKPGTDSVLLFLTYDENGETQYLNFNAEVTNNNFSIPITFSKTGNFQIGIIPGTNGTSKVYDISVLPSLPTATNAIEQAIAPNNTQILAANNKTKVSWQFEDQQVYKVNIWQDQKSVSYFTRQNTSYLYLNFKDFASFQNGKTYYSVESATQSSVAPLKISSPWTVSETKTFTASQHYSSFVYPDDIQINNYKDFYTSNSKITMNGVMKTPGNVEAAIIKPDGLVERVTLSSSSPTSKYYSYTILPANSSFTFQYTPKKTGTYIIEINKQNGAASFNVPFYVGTGIPLIPDYFEINQEGLSLAEINLTSARKEMLDYINTARQKQGLSTISLDEDLNNLSQLHSEDMATNNYFSHINLQGQSPSDRRKALNISTEVSENLGKSPSIRYGHEGLMRSAVHRENILDSSWTKVGLGFAKDTKGYIYITQEFSHDPYSESDLINFQEELFESINNVRNDFNLQDIAKNETLDKIAQALSDDVAKGISVSSNTLSNYFKQYNISNKAALVLSGTSPNNKKIITETTKGIDSSHTQWLEAGIDYTLDQFGSLIFVILYTN